MSLRFLRINFTRPLVWMSMVSMALPLFVPFSAQAVSSQVTSRKLTLASSAPGYQANNSTGDWTFTFTTVNTQTVGSIKFEICDDPLPGVSCVNTQGSNGVNAAAVSYVSGSSSGNLTSGASLNGSPTANTFILNKTVASTTAGANTLVFRNIDNPTGTNKTFFVRISLYDATAGGGTLGDYGSVAGAVVQQMTIQADVKETLTFCVYASGSNCATPGSATVDLSSALSGSALNTSQTGNGTHNFEVATNANSGYAVQYLAAELTGPAGTLPSGTTTFNSSTQTPGTEIFAFNVTGPNTINAGSVGAAPSGGSGTAAAGYATANQYSFAPNAATNVASHNGVSATTVFTATYVANINSSTKPGRYTTTMMFICTPTY